MPIILPRYESTASVQVGPLVDAGPAYQALATMFGGMQTTVQGFAQKRADENAQAAGAVAGMQPDFKTSKGIGEANATYNQAGLEANKLTLAADIGAKAESLRMEAEQNLSANSVETYKAAMQGYGKGVLANTPDENKPYVQNLLISHGMTGLEQLNKSLKERQDVFAYAQGMSNISSLHDMATNAAFNGNQKQATALTAQAESTARGMVMLGQMSKTTYSALELKNRKEMLSADVVGQYQNALAHNQGDKFLKDFDKSTAYDAILSDTDKSALTEKMQSMVKTRMAANGVTKQTLDNLKDNVLLQVKNGISPDAKNIVMINAGDPENSQNFQNELSQANYQHALVQNGISGNQGDMQQSIVDLNKVSPADLKTPQAAQTYATKQAAAKRIQEYQALVKDDPGEAVKNSPIYQNILAKSVQDTPTAAGQTAVNNFIKGGLANGMPQSAPGTQAVQTHIAETAPATLALQSRQGVKDENLTLVSNAEAAQVTSVLRGLPMANQMAALQQIQQLYGKNMQYVLPALAKAGLSMSSQLTLNATSSNHSLPYVPDMVNAFSRTTKELEDAIPVKKDKTKLMQNFKDGISQYVDSLQGYNNPTKAINDIYEQGYKLSLYLDAKGDNNPSTTAANALINSHYAFDSYNGSTYRIPAELAPGLTTPTAWYNRALNDIPLVNRPTPLSEGIAYTRERIRSSNLQVPSYFYPYLPAEQRKNLYIDDSAMAGHLLTSTDDSGLIFVDRYGVPVQTTDNKQFVLKFNEVQALVAAPSTQAVLAKARKEQALANSQQSQIPGDYIAPLSP